MYILAQQASSIRLTYDKQRDFIPENPETTENLETAIESVVQASQALRKLTEVLTNILAIWSRSVSHDGLYSSDLRNPHFLDCCHRIEEHFEGLHKIADLFEHLERFTNEVHKLVRLRYDRPSSILTYPIAYAPEAGKISSECAATPCKHLFGNGQIEQEMYRSRCGEQ